METRIIPPHDQPEIALGAQYAARANCANGVIADKAEDDRVVTPCRATIDTLSASTSAYGAGTARPHTRVVEIKGRMRDWN